MRLRSRRSPRWTGRAPGTFIVLHPTRTEVLIGGTFYGGEIKKSIFTVMNDRLPLEDVFPMHCSANVGERRPGRDLLRPLGHGEDDALGRPGSRAHRRRRARLGRQRRLQLRRRLLREGDQALRAGGARDLQDHAYVRHDPRERRDRRGRNARPRRQLEDREHARRVQARADRERASREARRASAVGRHADRRRVRDPAADRAAQPRAGALLLPLGLHGEARGHRDRRHRAAAHVLDVLRRAVPAAAAARLRGDARPEARRAPARRSGS